MHSVNISLILYTKEVLKFEKIIFSNESQPLNKEFKSVIKEETK